MKKLLMLIVLGAAGIGGYYAMTGRLPWVALSAEEVQITELRDELGVIRQQWKQAGRAGSFGVDTSTVTDVPLEKLQRLEAALATLTPRLKTPDARKQAEQLRRDLLTFKAEMR